MSENRLIGSSGPKTVSAISGCEKRRKQRSCIDAQEIALKGVTDHVKT
jgi:hypothetical protein